VNDKPIAHLLAAIRYKTAYEGERSTVIDSWCGAEDTNDVTIVLTPRDATHQGMRACEACLMKRDT